MDSPSALPNEAPNGGMWMPNGPPNGQMYPPYWQPPGVPPHALPPHMQQHRPGMPSTSNGPAPYGYPPMDQTNGFYNGVPNCGPMPPNMPMPPQGFPPMSNGDFHPPPIGTPNAHPPRVPSSGPQARASPFAPQPMPPSGVPMMLPYAGRPLPPPAYYPNGIPAASQGGGFVFTSEMANQAVADVQQGKQQNAVQWHCTYNGSGQPTAPPLPAPKNARNSPSYSTSTSGGRKRKGSQAQQERQNPTPSPQLNPPGSVPEFKQPMSNHAPGSVPDTSMMGQYPMGGMQQPLAKHPKTDTPVKREGQNGGDAAPKTENFNSNSAEPGNPIKKLEQMANSGDIATKPTKPVEAAQSREEKLAKLDQIKHQLQPHLLQQQPPMYPAYRYMPPAPNGMYYGHPNGPPGMMPQPGPYPMMPPASSGVEGMPPGNFGPPPGYLMNSRYPIMPNTSNGMPGGPIPPTMNGGPPRMPYASMSINMPRPPNGPEMYPQWQQEMPQPLANLDSRVPSQKIQYYGNGQQPPMGMPPGSMSNGAAPTSAMPS